MTVRSWFPAIHEAGHCTVGILLGFQPVRVFVSGGGGGCEWAGPRSPDRERIRAAVRARPIGARSAVGIPRGKIEPLLTRAAAGIAAAQIAGAVDPFAGAEGDREEVALLARAGGLDPVEELAAAIFRARLLLRPAWPAVEVLAGRLRAVGCVRGAAVIRAVVEQDLGDGS